MRVASYNPTLPVANGGAISSISPIHAATFNQQRMDWWDVVGSQLGNRVVDMLKESLYGKNFQPSILQQPPTSDWLRVTLENEIRYAQEQQMAYTQEVAEQDKQIKIAQIQAKSDLWLQEKAQKEAELQAELAALQRTQMTPEEIQASSELQTNVAQKENHTQDISEHKIDDNTEEVITQVQSQNENTDKESEQAATTNKEGEPLSDEEQRLINELASTDIQVKNHEAAHLGAAGGLARGGANYTYTEGPDGKLYAIAGEVSIDTSSTGDPKKDLQKAKQIQAAAMAPSDPSPQDYKVAANTAMMEMKAQMLLSEEFSKGIKKEQGIKIYKTNLEDVQKSQSSPIAFRIVA